MNPIEVIIIFILVWWCVFFAVLPVGVKGRWESKADGVAGADPGAPAEAGIKRKAMISTAVAAVLTAIISMIILSGLVNFSE